MIVCRDVFGRLLLFLVGIFGQIGNYFGFTNF